MAGEGGFEPPHTDPETAVLPLDDSPTEPSHHITASFRGSNERVPKHENSILVLSPQRPSQSFIGGYEGAVYQFAADHIDTVIGAAS